MGAARLIGILAGGGSLPREIADAITARGLPLHIVALDGEADADFGPYPVTRVNWGEIGRMVATLKENGATDLLIIGAVKRPDLATIKPDFGFVRALATVLGLVLAGGDDRVLRGVIAFFERQGLRVLSPADVAPELVIGAGDLTGTAAGAALVEDARRGFAAIAALGPFDIGQAAVVAGGRIEALEAAEGTDRMLARLGRQRLATGRAPAHPAGVLVKRTKPGQDLRIDLPAIGPATIGRAVECGLEGIAVEAGKALAAERDRLIAQARAGGIAVIGIPARSMAGSTGGERERDRGGGGERRASAERGSSWSARAIAALRRRRDARTLPLQQIGSISVPSRVRRDGLEGLRVIDAIAPFGGSRAVVVVRGHVLSVETGEGVVAAVERAGGLRQWGDQRLRRRAGVVVIEAGRDCPPEVVEIAAKARFAGLLVKLRRFTAGVPPETIAAADRAGLFIAGLPGEEGARHG